MQDIGWLEFSVRLIDTLVWPATIIILFMIFRGPLADLVSDIEKFKYKETEIDFGHKIEELAAVAEDYAVTTLYPVNTFPEGSVEAAMYDPESAIISGWLEIEMMIRDWAKANDINMKNLSNNDLLSLLRVNKKVNHDLMSMLEKIRNIRNQVVHDYEKSLTKDEAINWLSIIRSVQDRLKQALT